MYAIPWQKTDFYLKKKKVLDILERPSKVELHPLKNAVEFGDSEEL